MQALDAHRNHADLRQHLFTPGKLRSFVNVYLNDDDIRYLPAKEQTPTSPKDELNTSSIASALLLKFHLTMVLLLP